MVIRTLLLALIIAAGRCGTMKSDLRSSFGQPCKTGGLGVCAVFRAGVEFHLFSGGSLCCAADLPCGDGRSGRSAAAEDGLEGLNNGAGGAELVRRGGATHLRYVRD